jgi:predicted AlkP superfamily pyrophosphatase or phosphodiesterase
MHLFHKIDLPPPFSAYAPDVDTVTHDLGPDTANEQVQAALKGVDQFVLKILQGLAQRNALSFVDVIVVSDHGMTSTSNDKLLYLEDLLGDSLFSQLQHWDGWPNVGLQFANTSLLQAASGRLKEAKDVPYKIANREELVELWKWEMTETVTERASDLWILPDVGWSVTTKEEMSAKGQLYTPKG